ncbi:nitrate- and nitrite sensing domain-containing protein [Streptomyces sp. NPDC047014]|uniref:nitrate- and nitrite sensing domain-containing protein n=1 Tax=Streptomyces sp. NPDC047014 TaxID=3155736 RepID=UPI00340440EB
MQKKRSRKNGTAAEGPAPAGRRVRVRSRLVVGVAVAGLTVLAAGTPAVVTAARELNDSQRLVSLADQNRQILTLTHVLADERDAVVEHIAKGRPAGAGATLDERIGRTDRQTREAALDVEESLGAVLGRIPAVRTEAVGGKGTALAAHQAYTGLITELLAPAARLAELTPPRAEAALATTRPLAPLGQAVDQASATRGLLLAALSVPRGDVAPGSAAVDELTTAAQRSRVREQAALDDFTRVSRPDVRQTLTATVTGPEVKTADDYLKRLTDRPTLTTADRKTDPAAVGAALTARIDRMRTVESTLAGQRATAFATLRDDDVTRLEILVGVLGLLFLVAVGFSTAVARSLTRPLSVLRRGSERLATPEGSVEPVRFTGRNDEFAEVVRHLNAVRDQTVSLHTRIAGLDADRRRLIGRNEALNSGREVLEEELTALRAGLEEQRRIMSTTSVSLSLRTLGLVERQLTVIEELESREQDPDRLATLFKLDHLATVMRRHNENLLVLAGQEHGHGQGLPVALVDVMRAAVSEIERYERVDLTALPAYTQVAGHAADDISHVLAELLENATTFSPPEVKVKVSGWTLDSGDVVISVVDEGIGVAGDRLQALNERLATPEAYDEEPEAEHGLGLGLYVAGRLAARHGVTAELRGGRHGGTEALVVVPAALLPTTPPASPVHTFSTPGAPWLHLPGVIAEANENTLPKRARGAHAAPAPAEAQPAAAPETALPAEPVAAPAPEPGLAPETASGAALAAEPGLAPGTASGADLAPEPGFAPEVPSGATRAAEPDLAPGTASGAALASEPGLAPEAAPGVGRDSDLGVVPGATPERAAAADAGTEPDADPAADAASGPSPDRAMGAAPAADLAMGPDFDLPAGAAPAPEEPVATAAGPAEELLARVVPDAPLPPAEQVFVAAAAEEEAPARPADVPPPAPEAAPVQHPGPQAGPAGVADVRHPAPQADPAHGADVRHPAPQADPAHGADVRHPAPQADPARGADVRHPAPQADPARGADVRHPAPQADPARRADVSPHGAEAEHARGYDGPPVVPEAGRERGDGNRVPRQGGQAVTEKGLPKRTPRAVAPRAEAVRPQPPRRVDAEELRRRLGGFYQGAQDGRRVAAAEFAEDQRQAQSKTDQGDSAQEART